ncbi:hypothetical protein ATU3B_03625 [Agrobacterium genomosp. 3 str. CIP 111-78]|uniref:Uncharacterized protein n=1 Tax=Agrobacterium tumefaciens TaxID=358 RepID=A0AAE6BP23_AGRTU|nr:MULTISPECIES: hypothetical protein [Agrobacterium tumefaciens complex]MCA2370704.1 hypothetical protein [Agrobacterium tomkonis CIP 111-78]QCM01107.1 hypothetical protein CFBP6624_13830 [Agrobacterium tumefaciens]
MFDYFSLNADFICKNVKNTFDSGGCSEDLLWCEANQKGCAMITRTEIPEGTLYQSTGMRSVLVSKSQPELLQVADDAMKSFNNVAERFAPPVVPEEAATVFNRLLPPLKSVLASMRARDRNYTERFARIDAPAQSYDGAFETRYLSGLHALALPERIAAVTDLSSFAKSSALVRHNDLDALGLPPDIVDAVRQRHRSLSVMEMHGIRANHAAGATMDDPLASGVDNAAALADASNKVKELQTERDELIADARSVVDMVTMMAGLSNQLPQTLFNEIAA